MKYLPLPIALGIFICFAARCFGDAPCYEWDGTLAQLGYNSVGTVDLVSETPVCHTFDTPNLYSFCCWIYNDGAIYYSISGLWKSEEGKDAVQVLPDTFPDSINAFYFSGQYLYALFGLNAGETVRIGVYDKDTMTFVREITGPFDELYFDYVRYGYVWRKKALASTDSGKIYRARINEDGSLGEFVLMPARRETPYMEWRQVQGTDCFCCDGMIVEADNRVHGYYVTTEYSDCVPCGDNLIVSGNRLYVFRQGSTDVYDWSTMEFLGEYPASVSNYGWACLYDGKFYNFDTVSAEEDVPAKWTPITFPANFNESLSRYPARTEEIDTEGRSSLFVSENHYLYEASFHLVSRVDLLDGSKTRLRVCCGPDFDDGLYVYTSYTPFPFFSAIDESGPMLHVDGWRVALLRPDRATDRIVYSSVGIQYASVQSDGTVFVLCTGWAWWSPFAVLLNPETNEILDLLRVDYTESFTCLGQHDNDVWLSTGARIHIDTGTDKLSYFETDLPNELEDKWTLVGVSRSGEARLAYNRYDQGRELCLFNPVLSRAKTGIRVKDYGWCFEGSAADDSILVFGSSAGSGSSCHFLVDTSTGAVSEFSPEYYTDYAAADDGYLGVNYSPYGESFVSGTSFLVNYDAFGGNISVNGYVERPTAFEKYYRSGNWYYFFRLKRWMYALPTDPKSVDTTSFAYLYNIGWIWFDPREARFFYSYDYSSWMYLCRYGNYEAESPMWFYSYSMETYLSDVTGYAPTPNRRLTFVMNPSAWRYDTVVMEPSVDGNSPVATVKMPNKSGVSKTYNYDRTLCIRNGSSFFMVLKRYDADENLYYTITIDITATEPGTGNASVYGGTASPSGTLYPDYIRYSGPCTFSTE